MNKKILFITYENPFTRNTGDSIYTCNILDGLFSLSKNIDIIYFDSNQTEAAINKSDQKNFRNEEIIKFENKNPIKFIFSIVPGMIVNRRSNEYIVKLKNILNTESYDAIFLNHQKMMFTIPAILQYKKNAKLIYTSHNVEYLLSANLAKYADSFQKKVIYWQDAIKTRWYEKKWISFFDGVTAISEHDAEYFQQVYKLSKVDILRPVVENKNISTDNFQEKRINKLIIGGSFEWKPKRENLLLFLNAKNFHQLIENGIELKIVGRAENGLIDSVNNNYKGVHMTGAVPSLLPYYNESKIAIIPERLGGGFKLKIAEAALLKSAIFSIKGAITKCNFIKNKHFVEEDTFEELISEIIKVQQKPEALNNLIENAFSIANIEYTSDKIIDALKKVI